MKCNGCDGRVQLEVSHFTETRSRGGDWASMVLACGCTSRRVAKWSHGAAVEFEGGIPEVWS